MEKLEFSLSSIQIPFSKKIEKLKASFSNSESIFANNFLSDKGLMRNNSVNYFQNSKNKMDARDHRYTCYI